MATATLLGGPLPLGSKSTVQTVLPSAYAFGSMTPPMAPPPREAPWRTGAAYSGLAPRAGEPSTMPQPMACEGQVYTSSEPPPGVDRSDVDVDALAWKGWYTFKELEEIDRLGLYDPRTTTLPIPGVSSGMLESGMNYDYLPRGTELLAPVPPPSPLQEIVGRARLDVGPSGAYSVGHPARIVGLSCRSTSMYNDLVGDIVATQAYDNFDGSATIYFSLRCPLEPAEYWWSETHERPEHTVPVSPATSQAIDDNRRIIAPRLKREARAQQSAESSMALPPFLIVDGLPSENLEPVTLGSKFLQPGYYPDIGTVLPTKVAPAIWGPPVSPLPQGARLTKP